MKQLNKFFWISLLLVSLPLSVWAGGFHYRVDAGVSLLTDEQQRFHALQMSWLFDKELSDIVLEGYDMTGDKAAENLQKVASQMLDDMHEAGYFTAVSVSGQPIGLIGPNEFRVQLENSRIRLDFALPLQQPLSLKGKALQLSLFDPDASGTVLFAKGLKLAEPIKQLCQSPVSSAIRQNADEHEVIVETVEINCAA